MKATWMVTGGEPDRRFQCNVEGERDGTVSVTFTEAAKSVAINDLTPFEAGMLATALAKAAEFAGK